MKTKSLGYVVLLCQEGSAEEYVGSAPTLKAARKLVAAHGRGDVSGTPKSWWQTARASGNRVDGCDYPESHEDEPVEWAGNERYPYAICRITSNDDE